MAVNLEEVEKEIPKIKERNKKVEADKAWETSLTRRVFIALSTYVLILLLMFTLKVEKPFLSSLIPSIAYLVSTMSLEVIKKRWLERKGARE